MSCSHYGALTTAQTGSLHFHGYKRLLYIQTRSIPTTWLVEIVLEFVEAFAKALFYARLMYSCSKSDLESHRIKCIVLTCVAYNYDLQNRGKK